MDVFKTIENRRSVRAYKQRSVEQDDLLFLVEMGMKAPSSGNLEDTRFILCTDKKVINSLPELCMDQTWISTAPAIIVVCSQPEKQKEWYGEIGDAFARQNAAAAIQNISLAAHALGLGTCWIGGFNQDAIDELFEATGKARVEAIITIGYSNERIQTKEEEDITIRMYFNTYGNDKADLLALNKEYGLKTKIRIEEARKQLEENKSKAKVFIRNITEKIKTQHAEWKKNHHK